MALDPAVRAALESALASAPDNAAVRIHLASLLADEDPAAALDHAARVLTDQPDDPQGLAIAARTARAVGEEQRAVAYERLLSALTSSAAPAPLPEPTPSPSPGPSPPGPREPLTAGDALEGEADIDAFLAEVLGSDPDIERSGLSGPLRGPSRVTLADVGGLDEVKRRLNTSFLGPMRNPELRKMYGKSLRGSLLLYGPPGCGKTFLARAVAGELGARFFGIGLHEVLDMWLGQSERNLHEIFQTARRQAPCVLFLDEVDALGLKRSHLERSAGRNVVVQLLSELDSARSDNEGVFVLGATNQPWDIDPALRRPGRFDRTLLVLPPDPPARLSILRYHLRDRPLGSVDLQRLAGRTEGFSGADLRLLCESAAESALEDSLQSGTTRPIHSGDFDRALREVSPSTRPWFDVARNYAMFANEGGAYDDLLAYMRRHKLA
ncbi:MAG: Cell division protein FtsH [Actinobacteria bacterium]|nr:Cell division protein FtsH [Actinomycetota bacterium]